MKDRFQNDTCVSCFDNGTIKREILKANSSGRRRSSHDLQSSFFNVSLSPNYLRKSKNRWPVTNFVAEPVEIPIFKIPLFLKEQENRYSKTVNEPSFFNST